MNLEVSMICLLYKKGWTSVAVRKCFFYSFGWMNSLRHFFLLWKAKNTKQLLNINLQPTLLQLYFTECRGFSMLSVSRILLRAFHPLSSAHSIHNQKKTPNKNNQPHLCCPPPIPPHPSFLVVTSVRMWAPPCRKYSSAPFLSRLSSLRVSFVSWLHSSLCNAPCVS